MMKRYYCDICGKEIAEKELVQYTGENEGDYHGGCYERKKRLEEDGELPEVVHAYSIGIDGLVGFTFGESVMQELRTVVHAVLFNRREDIVAHNWTLNSSYKEDGEQVIAHYRQPPSPWARGVAERLDELSDCMRFEVYGCNFVDSEDRELVEKLCGMVARGEIEAKGEME